MVSVGVVDRSFWRARRPFLVSLCMVGSLALGVLVALTPRYETNDDAGMSMIAAGRGYVDRPDEHLLFSNVLVGLGLKALYETVPQVAWYGGFLFLTGCLSLLAICYVGVCRDPSEWRLGLMAVFLWLAGIPALTQIQFTRIAFLAALAGLLLLAETSRGSRCGEAEMDRNPVPLGGRFDSLRRLATRLRRPVARHRLDRVASPAREKRAGGTRRPGRLRGGKRWRGPFQQVVLRTRARLAELLSAECRARGIHRLQPRGVQPRDGSRFCRRRLAPRRPGHAAELGLPGCRSLQCAHPASRPGGVAPILLAAGETPLAPVGPPGGGRRAVGTLGLRRRLPGDTDDRAGHPLRPRGLLRDDRPHVRSALPQLAPSAPRLLFGIRGCGDGGDRLLRRSALGRKPACVGRDRVGAGSRLGRCGRGHCVANGGDLAHECELSLLSQGGRSDGERAQADAQSIVRRLGG